MLPCSILFLMICIACRHFAVMYARDWKEVLRKSSKINQESPYKTNKKNQPNVLHFVKSNKD